MGVLRWRSRLDEEIGRYTDKGMQKLDVEVLTALRLGAYQLSFLDRMPERAAVHESVELVKRARKRSAVPFTNAVLRKLAGSAAAARSVVENSAVSRALNSVLCTKSKLLLLILSSLQRSSRGNLRTHSGWWSDGRASTISRARAKSAATTSMLRK